MWLFPLVVAAGLALGSLLPVATGWAPAVMVVLAYAAGRKLASLALAVGVFAAVAVAGLALALARATDPLGAWSTMAMLELLAAVLPWWAGRYQRLKAEQRDREHEIVADQARQRERARIAQDMHDTIGHELALIALHGGALEIGAGLRDDQRRTAAELRQHATRATERLHDLVRVLGGSDAAAELRPADESIEELVRRFRAAGVDVSLMGHTSPLWPPMTRQAAVRVIREGLTNAARHAPGSEVLVTVGEDSVNVSNTATARPGERGGTGQGLIGLKERLRLIGGRFGAGPRPGGGWSVTAWLPDPDHVLGDGEQEGGAGPPLGGPAAGGPAAGEPAAVGGRPVAADDPPVLDVAGSRRLTRRRLLQTAALPVAVVLALIAAIGAGQAVSVHRTGLADDRYQRLRIGQAQAQVEAVLPPHPVTGGFRLIGEPAAPTGSECRYYHAGNGLTDLEPQVYRLCFAGGVLVAKDRLERA
jgi:signal transduction histidine kinase